MKDPKPVTVGPSSADMRPDDYVFMKGDNSEHGILTLTSVHADMLEPEPPGRFARFLRWLQWWRPRYDAPANVDVTLALPEEIAVFREGMIVVLDEYKEPRS